MTKAVIVDVVRIASGKGKPGGALSGTHPVELMAHVLRSIRRAKRPRPRPGGRRDRRLRRPGRRAGAQHHPQRGPVGRVPRVGTRHHDRSPVRIKSASCALCGAGRDRRGLRHRDRGRRRIHEPCPDGYHDDGEGRFRSGHRRSLPRRPGQPGHLRRIDRRQVEASTATLSTHSPRSPTSGQPRPRRRGSSTRRFCRSR